MRITFVLPPVSLGGGIKVVSIYADALMRMGHEVHLISVPYRKPSFRKSVKSFLQGKGWPKPPVPGKSHLDGSSLKHIVLDHWRPVSDKDIPDSDVVIATWWETAEWVNELSPQKGAKVYFIQGHEIFPHLPVERCHATYRLPMHKIVIAKWLQDVMSHQYGDNIVDVVPNSVDRSQFFAPPRGKQQQPTVGFLYSSTWLKGAAVAIEAITIVQREFKNLKIVSFGTHAPSENIPLPKGSSFFLAPPQIEIKNLYSQCDVWLSASRSEGFNLPAMEAMACRTPVVATKTGWPAEVLRNYENGVLVEIDDVAGLVAGISGILNLPEAGWRKVSDYAYQTSQAGSWADSAKQFESALLHACERDKRGEIGKKTR